MSIKIKSSDRLICVGRTGSGKTYLMRHLTQSLPRLVVLDGKGTLGMGSEWDLEMWNNTTKNKLLSGKPVRVRAIPGIDENIQNYWTKVLQTCISARNLVIYIDEMYAVAPPGKPPPPYLVACYTRGRELGIGTWASTQRPVWIPLVALSESEHFIMFRLQLEDDKKRMAAFMGEQVLNEISDPHGFYYSSSDTETEYYSRYIPSTTISIKVDNKPVKKPFLYKERRTE